MAVAHSIIVIGYHLVKRGELYRELGANYFDQIRPEATAQRLLKRLERIGYEVTIQRKPLAAAA